jgi:nucleoside-diphosphate-sugar epimerase
VPRGPDPTLRQVLAEREAWKLAEAAGLDLVAVLPNFVLGPVLSSRSSGLSVGFIKARACL